MNGGRVSRNPSAEFVDRVAEKVRTLVRLLECTLTKLLAKQPRRIKAQRPAGEMFLVHPGRVGWALNAARTGERVVK